MPTTNEATDFIKGVSQNATWDALKLLWSLAIWPIICLLGAALWRYIKRLYTEARTPPGNLRLTKAEKKRVRQREAQAKASLEETLNGWRDWIQMIFSLWGYMGVHVLFWSVATMKYDWKLTIGTTILIFELSLIFWFGFLDSRKESEKARAKLAQHGPFFVFKLIFGMSAFFTLAMLGLHLWQVFFAG